jgi:bifunctional non-homologous end joining protein LigD
MRHFALDFAFEQSVHGTVTDADCWSAQMGRQDRSSNVALPDVQSVRGAKPGLLPHYLEPSLAAACARPPSGPNWVHEIKHDGYRMPARLEEGRQVKLLTRGGLDWTTRFGSIAQALMKIGASSAWIDGEMVVEDSAGISSFNGLQVALKSGNQERLRYHVFDLLYCEGFDLTRVPLLERKALLGRIVGARPGHSGIRYSEHLVAGDGATILAHTCRLGLEGIVSKRADLPYRPGRGAHWLKSKCVLRQEFVIVGYIPSRAVRGAVGSLLLGYYDGKKLNYVGRVGTGYSGAEARLLCADLEKIHSARPSFGKSPPAGAHKGVRWAEPRLVCEVAYLGWTQDGLIRQASFKGCREDLGATAVTLEPACWAEGLERRNT